ncbi:hypothetical protein JP28_05715 [Gallibacterium anatis]|uniref:Uncharacterized protein n=1 Tax=Gallibacterium anatis 12656/12 TaxID=1195244 RepID=U1H2V0_9PAST|nr:hypothetical protein N561_03100 [Gallibacterium anatis 12656/12]KGQ36010.1 hypothetical protein JP34_00545 [Gallibacterium anatis]KGQ44170.1 hypothetical protein JP28_05715 [Gallibacterium anatis]KGQ51478.1 hypothetical protein JL04_01305 [Gallibacterium anatis]KGQ60920.1 hypothetical protein IO45_01595 [Gallibacterium anatis]
MTSEILHRYTIFFKYKKFLKLKSVIIKYFIRITMALINMIFLEKYKMLLFFLYFFNKKNINGIISNNDEKPILK